jgi:pimeloyl-ACP methyl ester carboxylesterase
VALEIIERGSAGNSPTLLFVHGFWQAAWTWDLHVMPKLAGMGHHCVALSLRGHGGSDGRIRGASISDYVEDVVEVVSSMGSPPVVVGHSMGGFALQHYLAGGGDAAGVVLVSPVPGRGAWGATLKAVRRHPLAFLLTNLTLDVGHIVATEDRAYDFLVADGFPRDEFHEIFERIERASYRTYMDLLLDRADLSGVRVPSLVVGGTEDAFFTEREWAETATSLGADLVILPGIGHQPMWEGKADPLVAELDRFLGDL